MSCIARRDPSVVKYLLMLAAVVLLPLASVGCNYPPTLIVRLDPATADSHRPVDVHLFAVDRANKEKFASVDVGDYWDSRGLNSKHVNDRNCKVVNLGSGTRQVTISKDDRIWKDYWTRGSGRTLMIFANLDESKGRTGLGDPRRVQIPLDPDRYDYRSGPITVSVGRSEVRVDPIPRAKSGVFE